MHNLEPTGHEQTAVTTRHYHEPVNPHDSNKGFNALIVVFILAFLILVLIGAVEAHQQLGEVGVLFFYGTVALTPLCVTVLVGYLAFHKWYMDRQKRKQAALDVEAKDNQVNSEKKLADAEAAVRLAEARRIDAESEKLISTIEWDEQGNAARFDPLTRQVIQLQGNMRQYPLLHTISYSIKQDGGKGDQVPALPPGGIVKPTIEEIVSQIARNSYEVGLGRSLDSREIIKAQLQDAHLKLIGGTRMGKSCEAGAILQQLSETHDRQHLLFALLDLENKTSRLFADDPHVMVVDTGYKKVKMHARTIEQVAHYLIMLHEMMNWRYTLTDAQLAALPAVLAYLEEFLYWKRQLANFVSKDVREQALMAFSGIATRGLKVKIHLMACAQVDYRDDELVEAMAQFIGVNVAFSVKPSAAQAAGFVSSDLLKRNYEARTPGQFVIEQVGGADIGMAPNFDVRAKLAAMEQTVVSEYPEKALAEHSELQPNYSRTTGRIKLDSALQAKLAQMMEAQGENMNTCIKRVWGATAGDNAKYKQAKVEYNQIQEYLHTLARQAMEGEA